MCGRFAFYSPHEAVVRLFGLPDDTPAVEPRYNIAPTTFIPAVRVLPDDASPDIAATRRLAQLYWGLVPVWAKEKSIGARMTNARAETLKEKPAFRAAYRKRRALVPADGYYEWMQLGPRDKQPYFIRPASGGPFALAALWEAWRDPASGEPLESCTLITTVPAKSIAYIHDRMPVIIPPALTLNGSTRATTTSPGSIGCWVPTAQARWLRTRSADWSAMHATRDRD